MQIVDNIKRKEKKEQELKSIDKITKYAKDSIESEYNKKPCFHNIVIKLYGSLYAEEKKEPDFYCLGCRYHLSSDDIYVENIKSYIIDLTYLYEGSTCVADKNILVSYMQLLAVETSLKIPEYDDADFIEMIEQNKEFIKVPKGFKPSGI